MAVITRCCALPASAGTDALAILDVTAKFTDVPINQVILFSYWLGLSGWMSAGSFSHTPEINAPLDMDSVKAVDESAKVGA